MDPLPQWERRNRSVILEMVYFFFIQTTNRCRSCVSLRAEHNHKAAIIYLVRVETRLWNHCCGCCWQKYCTGEYVKEH